MLSSRGQTQAAPAVQGHNPTAKVLHWLMAAIWLAAWMLGFAAVHLREQVNPHHGLTVAHKALASILLFLVVVRVAWRLTHPTPALPATMTPAERRAAAAGHVGLYALALFALPLSGWLWSSVADKPVTVLGLMRLPPLVAPNPTLYDFARLVHVTISWATGALVLGHALVALKHHFIDRDDVLRGMLPTGRASGTDRQA